MNGFTPLIRLLLFGSSYIPLILIFSVRNYSANMIVAVSGFVIAALLLFILLVVIFISRKLGAFPFCVSSVDYKASDLLTYMFSYVFPFLNIDLGSEIDMLCVGIFFIVLAVVYVNSNMIYINPMLSFLGFRIYQVTDPRNNVYVLITRKGILMVGENIRVCSLGGNILISKEDK